MPVFNAPRPSADKAFDRLGSIKLSGWGVAAAASVRDASDQLQARYLKELGEWAESRPMTPGNRQLAHDHVCPVRMELSQFDISFNYRATTSQSAQSSLLVKPINVGSSSLFGRSATRSGYISFHFSQVPTEQDPNANPTAGKQ